MKRKYKLRILQINSQYYIQWSYYWIWPTWYFIKNFHPGYTKEYHDLNYFNPVEAEVESRRFNTLEKTIKYNYETLNSYNQYLHNKKKEEEKREALKRGIVYKILN